MDFAKAKAFLQRKEGGSSVYDHLTEVVLKLVSDQPDTALAALEQLSAAVKSSAFPALGAGERAGGQAAAGEVAAARAAYLKSQAALLKAPGADGGEDGAGGAPGEPVQDFTDEANYLEWAGVSFGKTESFRIHLALKHLAAAFPARNLRLFGKVAGTGADYWVAEGAMDAPEDEADGAKDALGNTIHKTGDGPNKFTYFVCSSIGGAWTKLPAVTPHQVVAARANRRLLTGDLGARVGGHPPFPGTEANYLRALIAIVSAGTAIAPTGVFSAVDGDETGAIQPAEEPGDAPDLTSPDSWVHTGLALNALGRTRPNPPKTDDEGNEVPDENAPEPSAPLKPITEDAPVTDEAEGGGAWDIRPCPGVAGMAEGAAGNIVVVRSLRFPGAYTVGVGKKFTSVYIGNGLEVAVKPFQPSLPPAALPAEYDFAADGQVVKEKPDVAADPDAGKAAAGDGDGAEE
jgi:radial spoke head protein 4A